MILFNSRIIYLPKLVVILISFVTRYTFSDMLFLPFRFPVKLYYLCQCGFYLYSIGALVKWETRRKDFSVMMSHHIITVILISYSYITRYLSLVTFSTIINAFVSFIYVSVMHEGSGYRFILSLHILRLSS